MADVGEVNVKRKYELDALERGYVIAGLEQVKAQRKRGRASMVDGSELHRYATAEIARVEAILEKFK